MSYEREESFVEGTDADATTIESEFDNIADYFNNLFQGGRVSASEALSLTGTAVEVPGTAKTIVVVRPSLLFVTAVAKPTGLGTLNSLLLDLDGANQSIAGGAAGTGATAVQTWCVPLSTGSHTIKLRVTFAGGVEKTHTGYTYLVVPGP